MSAAGLRASLAPRASAASGGRAGDGRARRAAKARPAPRRRDRSPIHDADAATRTTAPAVSADAVQQVVAPTTLEARSSDPAIGDASAPARPPVETCQHVHLGSASSVAEALARVRAGLRGLTQDASGQSRGSVPPFASGVVRLTVAVPRTVDALEWLRSLPEHDDLDDDDQFGDDAAGVKAALLPRYYLSPRTPPPAIRSGEGDDGGDEHRHNRGTRDRGKGPGPTNDDGGADGVPTGSPTGRERGGGGRRRSRPSGAPTPAAPPPPPAPRAYGPARPRSAPTSSRTSAGSSIPASRTTPPRACTAPEGSTRIGTSSARSGLGSAGITFSCRRWRWWRGRGARRWRVAWRGTRPAGRRAETGSRRRSRRR